jgi:predicted DNA-binding transcriptional regulator AlpA
VDNGAGKGHPANLQTEAAGMITDKLLVKAAEAARLLCISEKSLWSLTAPRGPIPAIRIGERSIRYSTEQLKRWIEQQHAATNGFSRDTD